MPTVSCPFLLEFTRGPEFYVLAETLAIPHPLSGPWHSSVQLRGDWHSGSVQPCCWGAGWKAGGGNQGRGRGRAAGKYFLEDSVVFKKFFGCSGSSLLGQAFSPCGEQGLLFTGIFRDQGSNPCPLHWQADSYPLSHHGSPTNCHF